MSLLQIFEYLGISTFELLSLTNVYGTEHNISDVHVDSEDDGLEDGHDKELERVQFTNNNPE